MKELTKGNIDDVLHILSRGGHIEVNLNSQKSDIDYPAKLVDCEGFETDLNMNHITQMYAEDLLEIVDVQGDLMIFQVKSLVANYS